MRTSLFIYMLFCNNMLKKVVNRAQIKLKISEGIFNHFFFLFFFFFFFLQVGFKVFFFLQIGLKVF